MAGAILPPLDNKGGLFLFTLNYEIGSWRGFRTCPSLSEDKFCRSWAAQKEDEG